MARDVVPQRGFYSDGRISRPIGSLRCAVSRCGRDRGAENGGKRRHLSCPQTANAAPRSWSASFQDPYERRSRLLSSGPAELLGFRR